MCWLFENGGHSNPLEMVGLSLEKNDLKRGCLIVEQLEVTTSKAYRRKDTLDASPNNLWRLLDFVCSTDSLPGINLAFRRHRWFVESTMWTTAEDHRRTALVGTSQWRSLFKQINRITVKWLVFREFEVEIQSSNFELFYHWRGGRMFY